MMGDGWRTRDRWIFELKRKRPMLMGIINATPDSFSDGGSAYRLEDAIRRGLELEEQGAEILDVGGESTRPRAAEVDEETELRRVIPVIEALARRTKLPISTDTMKPGVARRACEAGAAIVNDVSGFRDPAMIGVLIETGAAAVIMHMAGTPRTMQDAPRYENVVREVRDYLAGQTAMLTASGIERSRICVDPGIGFGKTFDHNRDLLRNLDALKAIGCAVLIGTSRKSVLNRMTGRPLGSNSAANSSELQTASAVSALAAAVSGAAVARVHDVAAARDAIQVWDAQIGWERDQEGDRS